MLCLKCRPKSKSNCRHPHPQRRCDSYGSRQKKNGAISASTNEHPLAHGRRPPTHPPPGYTLSNAQKYEAGSCFAMIYAPKTLKLKDRLDPIRSVPTNTCTQVHEPRRRTPPQSSHLNARTHRPRDSRSIVLSARLTLRLACRGAGSTRRARRSTNARLSRGRAEYDKPEAYQASAALLTAAVPTTCTATQRGRMPTAVEQNKRKQPLPFISWHPLQSCVWLINLTGGSQTKSTKTRC